MTRKKPFFLIIVFLALLVITLTAFTISESPSGQLDPDNFSIPQSGSPMGNTNLSHQDDDACTFLEWNLGICTRPANDSFQKIQLAQ